MKLQFEPIQPSSDSSFTLLHHTDPAAIDVRWHYHPEYELVYLPRGRGRRHIGRHLSRYAGGELVFIGPDLPHLSFSYGRQTDFEQIVVQLRPDFLGADFLQRPELRAVQQLFARARQGLTFGAAVRRQVGPQLAQMLTQPPFERLLTLLQVLHTLAATPDATSLHADAGRGQAPRQESERLSRVYGYLQEHFRQPVEVAALAELTHLTVPAFCRYFKRMTGLTLTDFVQEYRVNHACLLLLEDRPITEVSFASGFNNLSHFNKTFRKLTGLSPSAYRQQQAALAE
ncbi:AraC family transcriptional regulator [Hymenobacter jeollabukensis]|uniref:Helix-turn-helix transcriptional regulator n=1 Tax=Hymenobacter jeollabukensis TaxID=2025313 RepID=A0A5R8WQM7_9BACT|nr:AraC family transcriptional regulator [Hymenobacter jeollabukensis]TLM92271.1 helix-turn-helix transcriptional regulator [Hymenobacter jeollabukensis]